jgi:L-fuconolactonase
MIRIDAHQHYWRIERGDYGWITPDVPVLFRNFLPCDLKPLLNRHSLDGTIVVQAAPTFAETEYILNLSETDETILGVVGYLDLNDPDCITQYEAFSQHPKYVGFRIMIQDMANASPILKPHFVEALRYFEEEDVPVDLLVVSSQLELLIELIRQVPKLRGVIDHLAKPRIAEGILQPWANQMQELAEFPNLNCKLSGMVTEADHHHWNKDHFVPYVRKVIELFGPSRVMFGSDWPVCLLAADYDAVMEILRCALPEDWSDNELQKCFGENAKVFYKL